MIVDSPSRYEQQPLFEGTPRGIITELRQLSGRGDDGFLNHILGFLLTQAALACHVVNEPPIRIEERLPANIVLHVAKPVQKAASGRNTVVFRSQPMRGTGYLGIHLMEPIRIYALRPES